MFDLRYHVASLAAVFVALLIGILVGVGLTGKVDDAEKTELRRQLSGLQSDLQAAGRERSNLGREQTASRELAKLGYPLLMDDRLRGIRIGLLFVGSVDRDVRSAVAKALEDAGGRGPVRMRALKLPIDPDRIDNAVGKRAGLARYQGEDGLRDLGRLLGQEFAFGGEAPGWDALATILVEEQRGRARPPLDALVVSRNVDPQAGPTAKFLAGLYGGLADTGIPAVGVETSSDQPSAVGVFAREGLSTVDDIDTAPGRAALALLLAGAEPGTYGVKETADRIMPQVEPRTRGG